VDWEQHKNAEAIGMLIKEKQVMESELQKDQEIIVRLKTGAEKLDVEDAKSTFLVPERTSRSDCN
jgi:hypothetical protein